MVWLRVTGLVLSISGVLSVLLIPMWGAGALLTAFALIIVGAVLLVVGTRCRGSADGTVGGPYGSSAGLDIGDGGSHHYGGHDSGHGGDGGH
jgi:hypothetical protein